MQRFALLLILVVATSLTSGCVYSLAVQQGNLVDQEKVDQVTVGMTRNQVRFLLGTPLVNDSFNRDRWDYLYYIKQGRKQAQEKHWITVYFENDEVINLERGVTEELEELEDSQAAATG